MAGCSRALLTASLALIWASCAKGDQARSASPADATSSMRSLTAPRRRLQDDQGHNCENGAKFWAAGWSSGGADQEWCCRELNIGCADDSGQEQGNQNEQVVLEDQNEQVVLEDQNEQVVLEDGGPEDAGDAPQPPDGDDAPPPQDGGDAPPPPDGAVPAPAPPGPPTTMQWSFNCHHFLLQWKLAWSVAKQEYCCAHESLGCPSTSTSSTRTTTTITSTSTSTTLTTSTITTTTATTTTTTKSYLYACHEDIVDWESKWPEEKQAWCCVKEGIGCTTTSTTFSTTTTSQTRTLTTSTSTTTTFTFTPTTTTTTNSTTTTSSYEFACLEGLDNWDTEWSERKKSWCCYHEQRGCSTTTTTFTRTTSTITNTSTTSTRTITITNTTTVTTSTRTSTTTPLYDCLMDLDDWKYRWSAYKQEWCCQMQQLGCIPTTTTTTTTKPDCWRAKPGDELAWSEFRRHWCCEHENVGCTTTTSTVTSTNTTTSTSTNTTTSTTTETRTLTNTTTTTTSSYPYACDRGLSDFMSYWTEEKMSWCCENQQVGCTTVTTTTTTSTETSTRTTTTRTVTTTSTTSSVTTSSTTSTLSSTSTTPTTTSTSSTSSTTTVTLPLFECIEGASDMEASWSDRKKDWCCNHGALLGKCSGKVLMALAPQLDGHPYDCKSSTAPKPNMTWDWEAGWVLEGDTRTYNCTEDLEKWATCWSDGKKEYCCKEQLKWCPKGFRRELGWTDAKTEWCCSNEGMGCDYTTKPPQGSTTSVRPRAEHPEEQLPELPPPEQAEDGGEPGEQSPEEGETGDQPFSAGFRCQEDLAQWDSVWSEDKMVWCCQNEQLGCPGYVYQPEDGQPNEQDDSGAVQVSDGDDDDNGDFPIVITQSYDCSDQDSWETLWSDDKKRYCCDSEGFGCATRLFSVERHGHWTRFGRPVERSSRVTNITIAVASASAIAVAVLAVAVLARGRRASLLGGNQMPRDYAVYEAADPSTAQLMEALNAE